MKENSVRDLVCEAERINPPQWVGFQDWVVVVGSGLPSRVGRRREWVAGEARFSGGKGVKALVNSAVNLDVDILPDVKMTALWTVGVICVDNKGHIAFGASSRGIALKLPGTSPKLKAIEIAAAYNSLSVGMGYFGSSMERPKETTTNGRVLISFQLRAFVPGYPVHPVIVRYPLVHFDQSCSQHGTDKTAGTLVDQAEARISLPGTSPKLKAIEIAAAYNSLSVGMGYFGSSMERPKVSIFRTTKQQNRTDTDQFAARIDVGGRFGLYLSKIPISLGQVGFQILGPISLGLASLGFGLCLGSGSRQRVKRKAKCRSPQSRSSVQTLTRLAARKQSKLPFKTSRTGKRPTRKTFVDMKKVMYRSNIAGVMKTVLEFDFNDRHVKQSHKIPFWLMIDAIRVHKLDPVAYKKCDATVCRVIQTYNPIDEKFYIGGIGLPIRNSDIRLLFGWQCGKEKLDLSHVSKGPADFIQRRCPNVSRISSKVIKDALVVAMRGKTERDEEDVAKLMCLYICAKLFFPTTGESIG
ncbi:hypothetical protein TEA_015230 [Camellia sinensis var. sinensis]|uniref:Uncharacterized protein n=1 Tax=Camellia sinensis var. sinensis TaxID=542762 RepID=A0A4S4DWW2_CAMSN|nr:hypothetical protein TEA_015230 [Camellia sinensis var. sinensis]